VLDLSILVPGKGGIILGKVKGIERVVTRVALALDGLEKSNNTEDLNEGDPEDDLGATTLGNEVVVGIDGGKLGEEGEGVLLLDEETQNGKHGEAAVLELGLTENTEVENVRETLPNISSENRGILKLPSRLSQMQASSGKHHGWHGWHELSKKLGKCWMKGGNRKAIEHVNPVIQVQGQCKNNFYLWPEEGSCWEAQEMQDHLTRGSKPTSPA
jgi:hypothetical protein